MAFVHTYNQYEVAQNFVNGWGYSPILVWRR
jgi:hypothetical protein